MRSENINYDLFPVKVIGDDISSIRAAKNTTGAIGVEVKISNVSGESLMIQLLENFGNEWVLKMIDEL